VKSIKICLKLGKNCLQLAIRNENHNQMMRLYYKRIINEVSFLNFKVTELVGITFLKNARNPMYITEALQRSVLQVMIV
jgi:hypothetical protein